MWGGSQKIKAPTPERKTFAIKNFSGGLVNTVSPTRMQDHQSSDMLNVMFEQDGVLKKRYGFRSFDILKEGHGLSGKLRNVWTVSPQYKEGEDKTIDELLEGGIANKCFIVHLDKNLYYVNQQGEVTPIVEDIWKSDIQGCQFLNKFYFVTIDHTPGLFVTHMYYFDLADLKTYRVITPPAGFTPAPKPATSGVVKTRVASDYGDQKLYEAWYEPCQAELEDGFKGANVVPQNCSIITVSKDRVYLSGNALDPNMVYISDIMQPLYFPSALPLQPPANGDHVTNLHVFSDSVVVGRREDLYCIYGNTNRTDAGGDVQYKMKRINAHTGMPNPNCSNQIANFLFFVGTDGNAYKLNTTQTDVTLLQTKRMNELLDFTAEPINKTISEIHKVHTGFDPTRSEWYIQIGDDTIVFNYTLMAWTRYNNTPSIKFINTDKEFLFTHDDLTFGILDKNIHWDEYPLDEKIKIPIECYWKSKTIDFNDPARIKQIRDTYVVSESYEDYDSTVMIKYDIDYADVDARYTIQNEISRWDKAIWDKNRFVAQNIMRSLPMMIGRRGRTFKLTINSGYRFIGIKAELPAPEFSEIGDIFLINNETETKFYERTAYDLENALFYKEITDIERFFQPFKIYEISGIYELRGYR